MNLQETAVLLPVLLLGTVLTTGCFEESGLYYPESENKEVKQEEVPQWLKKNKKDERQGGKGRRHKGEEGRLDDLLAGASVNGSNPRPSGSRAGKPHMARSSAAKPSAHYGIAGPANAPLRQLTNAAAQQDFNTEGYDHQKENGFKMVTADPLSTFSIDVDTASYSNVRRFLRDGRLPPKGAVRIEEMINYFTYDYPVPTGNVPFSSNVEIASCPWNEQHRLVRIGLKGRVVEKQDRKPANLVFLLDVSGSMHSPNKLPLLKRAFKLAVSQLNDRDRVAMVVYAGASGLVLPSTRAGNTRRIMDALDNLRAGGSTNAGDGIELAYKIAQEQFIKGGTNRVILATDGDFNVGITNQSDLVDLVSTKAKRGIFLTVLGFGMGNYKDDMLEKLADNGNGNYGYIDTFSEARKIFAEQISGTLETIAKDVKIQVEFNPSLVAAYRLLGYENRMLAAQDFNDDKKDAGEIGAGHTVTALYQVVPRGVDIGAETAGVDPLKYQQTSPAPESGSNELLTLKLRYKAPNANVSRKITFPIQDENKPFDHATQDFKFATAVASFGMLLRESKFKATTSYENTIAIAQEARGTDKHGYRAEFLRLVHEAKELVPTK